jgi:hypothetical protein
MRICPLPTHSPQLWHKKYFNSASYPRKRTLSELTVFLVLTFCINFQEMPYVCFSIFSEKDDVSGLDLAFIDRGNLYHSTNDTMEHVSNSSLASTGENLLHIVKKVAVDMEELPQVCHFDG